MASNWKSLRAGEERAEALLNTSEPDGHNNGKAEVDDTNGAHAFLQLKEEHNQGKAKLKPLKERLAETEAKAQALRKKLKRSH